MIPLRTTLLINAASSTVTGIALVFLSKQVAQLFDVQQTLPFVATGIFLMVFGAFVFLAASKRQINETRVKIITSLDKFWVIASCILIILTWSSISSIGIIAIALVAVWVAFMAFLQQKGLSVISSKAVNILIIFTCALILPDQLSYGQSANSKRSKEFTSTETLSREISIDEESNRAVRVLLEAFQEKNHAKAGLVMDTSIQWYQPGHNRFSGIHQNTKEVFALFKGFLEMSVSTLKLTDIKFLGVNGNGACLLHWNAHQPHGAILDIDNIDVYTVKNGKIVKVVVYSADIQKEDEFWTND